MVEIVKDSQVPGLPAIQPEVIGPGQDLTKPQGIVKPPIEPIRYLTRQEIHRFLDAIPLGMRHHHLLFTVLWRTGLRISEALDLRKRDVDLEKGIALVTWLKKRRKAKRYIKLHSHVTQLIGYHVAGLNAEDKLFPISRQRADQLAKRYGKIAGITLRVHCHLFRHSFAVNFLEQSPRIGDLKRHLGHANIQTTAVYLQVTNSDLGQEMERLTW